MTIPIHNITHHSLKRIKMDYKSESIILTRIGASPQCFPNLSYPGFRASWILNTENIVKSNTSMSVHASETGLNVSQREDDWLTFELTITVTGCALRRHLFNIGIVSRHFSDAAASLFRQSDLGD